MGNTNFKKVLEYCEKEKFYLGEGNPDAKILIIGKEQGMAAHKNKDVNREVSENSIKENLAMWHDIVFSNNLEKYIKYLEGRRNDKKWETLRNYQVIMDKIREKRINKEKLDFYEDCFITEMNQIQLQSSNKANNLQAEREYSIKKRESLFRQSFFQNFPIVIMACGHYPRDFGFDIQDIFKVEFIEPTGGNEKYWYNIHFNKDYKTNGKNRILIHTRQMSNFYDNRENIECFLSEITELCKTFYK